MIYTEEKKAIEDLRKTVNYYSERFEENGEITAVLIDNFDVRNLFVLLNLVEKQQKEIDRLENKDNEYMKIQNNNLQWQEKYNELKKKIENSKQFQVYISGMRSGKELLNKYINDSISKNKIREKIKEIEDSLKEDCIALHEFQRLAKIDVLKELLGDE